MNNLSTEKGIVNPVKETFADNTLTEQEKKDGWSLLFDGKKIDQFRNFKKKTIGSSWIVNENAIHLNAIKENGKWQSKDGGDIITNETYENFEFKYDWKITNCGNSGVIFNAVEEDKYDYVWQTGPEMQVLDNVCHPDTRYVTHRAGDLYDLIESKYPCSKPAGQWNRAMIRSNNGKVDFYLNGYKIVSFDLRSKAWQDMISKSKFKEMPGFGKSKSGHIALQDHGDKVWYKNIKIRKLN
jgi:cytochrome c